QAHHHAVARLDQRVVADRLADQATQALLELVRLEFDPARVARRCARRRSAGVETGCVVHGAAILPAALAGVTIVAVEGEQGSMQTILVANPKGGSGKTTVATNVAGWLAGKRQRVALADLDPQ